MIPVSFVSKRFIRYWQRSKIITSLKQLNSISLPYRENGGPSFFRFFRSIGFVIKAFSIDSTSTCSWLYGGNGIPSRLYTYTTPSTSAATSWLPFAVKSTIINLLVLGDVVTDAGLYIFRLISHIQISLLTMLTMIVEWTGDQAAYRTHAIVVDIVISGSVNPSAQIRMHQSAPQVRKIFEQNGENIIE